jgi:hypothetical protein
MIFGKLRNFSSGASALSAALGIPGVPGRSIRCYSSDSLSSNLSFYGHTRVVFDRPAGVKSEWGTHEC